MEPVTIRQAAPGESGYVSWLHMTLYEKQYGFRPVFEYYVMAGLTEFLHDGSGGKLWVAVCKDEIVGSIAMVNAGEDAAQLRWFLIKEGYQGLGTGQKLMDTAMAFAKDEGYEHIVLWTADMLHAAKHLYTKYGFTKTEEKENTEWTGRLVMEERWDTDL